MTTPFDLSGKRALVCGAGRGIGRSCAVELASLGAQVVLLSRGREALEATRASLAGGGARHQALVADMTDLPLLENAVQNEISQRGTLHILVHNSGGPPPGAIRDATWSEFEFAFRHHVGSAHLLASLVLPGMCEAGYGRIVNVLSTSVRQPIPGLGVSNTVRGAMASWAKTLSSEVARFGVTVNNVLPGSTKTDRLQDLFESWASKAGKPVGEIEAAHRASIPAGRFAEPEEIGRAVAFLASPAASYVTGTSLLVDGGRTSSL